MKKNRLFVAGALAALGVALIALPSRSASTQGAADATPALQGMRLAQARAQVALQRVQEMQGPETQGLAVVLDDEGPSWLGVETHEVTPDSAKELKLPAERGVVVGRIVPDSPAAKAGLKEKDVITDLNGQRVEGSAQFRRMIHEIPAGRGVQLTVWRDGRTQTLSATLGKAEEGNRVWMNEVPTPGAFAFHMPKIEIPPMMFDNDSVTVFPGSHSRLGIDAEDVSGQLGNFFGVPDGEGVLVRSVNAASAAEKAGVKAGDVITTFDGERIRSLGDLREKLAAKNDDKPAKLGILRNKSEITVTVELPAPKVKSLHKISRSTNI
jgi:serine protease Do